MRLGAHEKISVGVALLVVALTAGWTAWQQSQARAHPLVVSEPQLSTEPYQAVGVDAPTVAAVSWASPTTRSAWAYDMFTPPEIYYNPRTKEFTVTPPGAPSETVGDAVEAPFGLEVVEVKQQPYRLQLVGFVGGEGSYLGAFQNVETSEHFLSRGNQRLPQLGLTILRCQVRRERADTPERTPSSELVATAEVRDERANTTLTLSSRSRLLTGEISATVTLDGGRRVVRAGDTIKSGFVTYRIEKITLTPAAVEVVREAPDLTEPERRSLSPRAAEASASLLTVSPL